MIRTPTLLATVVCISLLAAAAPKVTETFTAKVIGVSDGDTIRVLRNKEQLTIRLEGIDAPEVRQSFGTRSKQALSQMAFGATATIRKTGEDRFGRTLGFVEVNGVAVNSKMIEDGWAWNYKKYNDDQKLAELENQARNSKSGLWADPTPPLSPWEFRARSKITQDTPPSKDARYWLNTSSNVRHNAKCEHFGKTKKGRECKATDGNPCGICGG